MPEPVGADERFIRPHGALSELLLRVGDSRRGKAAMSNSPAAREVAMRFIAAENTDDVLAVVTSNQDKGLLASLEPLVGVVSTREDAVVAVREYVDVLAQVGSHGLGEVSELSIRPSRLGLGLGRDGMALATENLATICRAARNAGAMATLEMEDHRAVDAGMELFTAMQQDFPWLGITVQSQLRRSLADCRWLATTPTRVRLCKGGYSEPGEVAFDDRHEIDKNFVRCLGVLMAGKGYPMLATHDPRLVKITQTLAERHQRSRADYEFQMYHGVRPWEHRRLVDVGHRVRVHLPFGENWYGYLARRVAERPANAGPLLRALVTRR